MLEGLHVTLTAVIVDDCEELLVGAKLAPLHPTIHTMPEKRRPSNALRCMVYPPIYPVRYGISTHFR
jgi:hypothetical protein